jgi:transcriptional regulator with XRE-family HTH domain
MTSTLTIGERIAWYRRRRGMSQEVLAGLVSRTTDWLSKVENGRIELDRLSVLRSLANALDVALGDLIDEPSLMEWTRDSGRVTVPGLRSVLMDYRQVTDLARHQHLGEAPAVQRLKADVDDVWSAYQESRFGYVTHQLVRLIPAFKVATHTYPGDEQMLAFGRLALLYHVAASTLTKLGEPDLAWTASDRGVEAAQRSENPVVIGSLLRSVAHSLLSTGDYAEAIGLTRDAVDFYEPHVAKPSPRCCRYTGRTCWPGPWRRKTRRPSRRTRVPRGGERRSPSP